MFEYSFEKLEIWKESINLIKTVYVLTKEFNENEKFGLVSQMRRSSISIASNIAEGTSRNTAKDKAHFTTMAYSSTMELLNQFIIAKELNFLEESKYLETRLSINKIANMLNSLRKYQIKTDS